MRSGSGRPAGNRRFIPTRVGNASTNDLFDIQAAVHPHACGECSPCTTLMASAIGSSPRVWGMPHVVDDIGNVGRFIPTRVGNAEPQSVAIQSSPVHPHACGECMQAKRFGMDFNGSSPRVWGMPKEKHHALQKHRFIPTRVGNAGTVWRICWNRSVHPHACGECVGFCFRALVRTGSSPRVWGMLRPHGKTRWRRRFIPTRVGNAKGKQLGDANSPVHPHACGECGAGNNKNEMEDGSSPRVWGMHLSGLPAGAIGRFIPTRVGNARTPRPTSTPTSVHPHACGECSVNSRAASVLAGSSPRVWGMQAFGVRVNAGCRFIPTRVGNAFTPAKLVHKIPVHPHACGECTCSGGRTRSPSGSSPRVWGMH